MRVRLTLAVIAALTVLMVASTAAGVIAVRNIGRRSADQMLLHLCESGVKNLDSYFDSVAQSVEIISDYTKNDLEGVDDESLTAHLDRVRELFATISSRTNGVLTYYTASTRRCPPLPRASGSPTWTGRASWSTR